jgi:hypothetical protein
MKKVLKDMKKIAKAGKAKIATPKKPDRIERRGMWNRGLHDYRFKDIPLKRNLHGHGKR